jgi:hypothetical protein
MYPLEIAYRGRNGDSASWDNGPVFFGMFVYHLSRKVLLRWYCLLVTNFLNVAMVRDRIIGGSRLRLNP